MQTSIRHFQPSPPSTFPQFFFFLGGEGGGGRVTSGSVISCDAVGLSLCEANPRGEKRRWSFILSTWGFRHCGILFHRHLAQLASEELTDWLANPTSSSSRIYLPDLWPSVNDFCPFPLPPPPPPPPQLTHSLSHYTSYLDFKNVTVLSRIFYCTGFCLPPFPSLPCPPHPYPRLFFFNQESEALIASVASFVCLFVCLICFLRLVFSVFIWVLAASEWWFVLRWACALDETLKLITN